MKVFFVVMIYCLNISITAGQINYTGQFEGVVNGDPTTLILKQIGSDISGLYQETVNAYDIKGIVIADKFNGELLISGTTTPLATFIAFLTKAGLHMDLELLGITPFSIDFIRTTNGSSPNTSKSSQGNKVVNPIPGTQDKFKRDPAVVGQWIKEEIINSGVGAEGASLVTVFHLNIKADGTFVQEKSSAGGGSTWSSKSRRELDASGAWYTQDQVFYVKPQGYTDFVKLNRYLFHEGALVFKTDQGKYLIWNRSN